MGNDFHLERRIKASIRRFSEIHVDDLGRFLGLDLISPFPYRLQRGFGQQWVAANAFRTAHRPIRGDPDFEFHRPCRDSLAAMAGYSGSSCCTTLRSPPSGTAKGPDRTITAELSKCEPIFAPAQSAV
jgi:hypothetical protein